MCCRRCCFFFNDTATTEIYTLSLHDALPIYRRLHVLDALEHPGLAGHAVVDRDVEAATRRGMEESVEPVLLHLPRSEEHTSELQSRQYLVCRLLLEKKQTYFQIHRSLRFPSH